MEAYLLRMLKPPRLTFNTYDLGPSLFKEGPAVVRRHELNANSIPFSLYEVNPHNPTIIYIHTYNSHRLEVQQILRFLVSQGFNVASIELHRVLVNEDKVVSFNNREGVITFGHYQFEQIKPVFDAIQKRYINADIILWGRSMGAACAVLYQAKYGNAKHLVLDSPFHNIQELMAVKFNQITSCPNFIAKKSVSLIRGTLNDLLHFDISHFKLEEDILKVKCSISFLYNPQDAISNNSTHILYQGFTGSKEIFYTEASHQEARESLVIESICSSLGSRFISGKKTLVLKKLNSELKESIRRSLSKNSSKRSSLNQLIISEGQKNEMRSSQTIETPKRIFGVKKLLKLGGSTTNIMEQKEAKNCKSTRYSTMLSEI